MKSVSHLKTTGTTISPSACLSDPLNAEFVEPEGPQNKAWKNSTDPTLKPKLNHRFVPWVNQQNKANLVRVEQYTGNNMAFHYYATASELGACSTMTGAETVFHLT